MNNKFNFYIATALCCCTVASQSFAMRREATVAVTTPLNGNFSNYNVKKGGLYVKKPWDFNTFLTRNTLKRTATARDAVCFRLFPDNSRFENGDPIDVANQDAAAAFAESCAGVPLFFGIGDIHGGYSRYDSIVETVRKVVEKHPQGFFLCIAGDLNRKHDLMFNRRMPDVTFTSQETTEFLRKLKDAVKSKNPSNEVFLVLGNHDTKMYGGSIGGFINIAEGLGIRVLTNTPNAFTRGNFVNPDYLTTVSQIMGNVAVIPYMGNFAQTGLDAEGYNGAPFDPAEPECEFTDEWREAFREFYQDGNRNGIVDKLFKGDKSLEEENEKDDPFTFVGNPKNGPSLVAKALADTWFGTVRKLGEVKDEHLEVMTIAHDHFLRPLVLLELLSKHCPEYRLSPDTLKRLRVTILAAHELPAYMFDRDLILYGSDDNAYRIPCRTGANGLYGEACSLFSMPNSTIESSKTSFKLDDLTNTEGDVSLVPQFPAKYVIQCHGETLAARALQGNEKKRITYVNLGDIDVNSLNDGGVLLRVDFANCPFWDSIESSTFEELAGNAKDRKYVNEKLNRAFWTKAEFGCKKHIGTIVTIYRGADKPAFLFQMCAVKDGQVVEDLNQEGLCFGWRLRGLLENEEDVAKVEAYLRSVLRYRR